MTKIYRCPKNCHVSNTQKRCPVCGKMLLYDGIGDEETAKNKTIEIQREHYNEVPQYRGGHKPNRDDSGIHKSKFYMN